MSPGSLPGTALRAGWLIATALLVCALPVRAETIEIATGEFPPFIGEHILGNGLHAERVRNAMARAGVDVHLVFLPWKRALVDAARGRHHGTMLWRDTPERRQEFHVSAPVCEHQWVFFHLAGRDFDWQEPGDLRGLRIGAIRGFIYEPAFDEAGRSGMLNVRYVARNELLVKMLVRGRIDLLPMELHSGYHTVIEHLDAERAVQVTHHPRPMARASLHLLLSRKVPGNRTLLNRFDRALQELRDHESRATPH